MDAIAAQRPANVVSAASAAVNAVDAVENRDARPCSEPLHRQFHLAVFVTFQQPAVLARSRGLDDFARDAVSIAEQVETAADVGESIGYDPHVELAVPDADKFDAANRRALDCGTPLDAMALGDVGQNDRLVSGGERITKRAVERDRPRS